MKKSLKLSLIIVLLAALAMPISAASDRGLSHDDPLKESHVDYIPGYGIIAYTISLNANPDNMPANGISTSTIEAQLKDRKGKDVKVKDVIINFQTKKGTLSANSAVTNNNGRATVTLTSSTKPETANIKASSDSVLNPGKTKVEFKAVKILKIYGVSLTAVSDNILADGKSTSTITAQLKDNHGNDVSVKNVKINFETTKSLSEKSRCSERYPCTCEV
jgi:adhesin/invasin